jgi:predicted secreted protein
MTGKDIILVLSQGGTALASTAIKSQDIQTEADVLEKASSSQQSWREYIAGRKGWSVTLSYLVLTSEKILDLLKVGQTFSVTMKKADDNTNKVTGNAILKSVKQTASVGNLAQGSWQLQGTGALV